MFLEGTPATFIDSTEKLRTIVATAETSMATQLDLTCVLDALRERFPPTITDENTHTAVPGPLMQIPNEPLAAYYSRAVTTVRQSGSRDTGLGGPPLSPVETYILQDFVQKFIKGLWDKELMREAINQSALSADSLHGTRDIIKRA